MSEFVVKLSVLAEIGPMTTGAGPFVDEICTTTKSAVMLADISAIYGLL